MSSPLIVQIKKALKKPRIILSRIVMLEQISRLIPDKSYLKMVYYLRTGQKLDLDYPQTFNEKIQWLKLHNSSDLCSQAVDKFLVRNIVEERIGNDYLIPLIGTWERSEDIEFDRLPNEFVLKCNHDSGSVIVCRDKSKLDISKVKQRLSKALQKHYFWVGREYPYKKVRPRIICEKLMQDNNSPDLVDYKFFCFNGEPKILFYASERFTSSDGITRFDFYDMDFHHLDISREGHPHSTNKPNISMDIFDKMKFICRTLSKDFPFVRVDLYLINNRIYFGELTFHPGGGFVNFVPEKWNSIFGKWINIANYNL